MRLEILEFITLRSGVQVSSSLQRPPPQEAFFIILILPIHVSLENIPDILLRKSNIL